MNEPRRPSDQTDPAYLCPPPSFSGDDALAAARSLWGIEATGVRSLGSERDQALLLSDDQGRATAVMKIANAAQSVDVLDLEADAALRVARLEPTVPVAVPIGCRGGRSDAIADLRADVGGHWVRMFPVLPGSTASRGLDLTLPTVQSWGETTARVARALRGLMSPEALRTVPWDVANTAASRSMVPAIADATMRSLVERVIDRFVEHVEPHWPLLRSQIIHTDLGLGNVLLDNDAITGVIDFGDIAWTAQIVDYAAALSGLIEQAPFDDSLRIARLYLDGVQRITPLEDIEWSVLPEVIAARHAIGIAITSWRERENLDGRGPASEWRVDLAGWLDALLTRGWDRTRAELEGRPAPTTTESWSARREAAVGAALEPLSYDEPIHVASASGVWITDVNGHRFLDAYNNVPCVGHSHPRVIEAAARQWRQINTNMRYLHEASVELAERLIATLPPGLDTVLFVNSGTEANDLAWRMAKQATGAEGGLCTTFAYHGISDAMAPFSPETLPPGSLPTWLQTWEPADASRGAHLDSTSFENAVDRLHDHGHQLAATILDGVLQSDGVLPQDPALVRSLFERTKAAGGLWVADEVQGGHGRTGEHLWSFQRCGIEPDFVTMGKPMGNGFPVAAVVTRAEIAYSFRSHSVIFSTFGGNPVAAAAALAVLDVIDDEDVIARTEAAGRALRHAVRSLAVADPRIGEVRGIGLANGIELVRPGSTDADPVLAGQVKNLMRQHGVLVSATGPRLNVLKVRPPLAFTEHHVEQFVDALQRSLAAIPR